MEFVDGLRATASIIQFDPDDEFALRSTANHHSGLRALMLPGWQFVLTLIQNLHQAARADVVAANRYR